MKIAILCSSSQHPIYGEIQAWTDTQSAQGHQVSLCRQINELPSCGEILFLIACSAIIPTAVRSRFQKTLVVHASDLPMGRGWSPYVWRLLEGHNEVVVSLLDAEDPVDSGDIWLKTNFLLAGHELHDEIHHKLNAATIKLMNFAISNLSLVSPQPQNENGGSYYRRRTPEDSRIDPEKSIASQFNLLRVCDPDRYPAFFDYLEHRYYITIRKDPK